MEHLQLEPAECSHICLLDAIIPMLTRNSERCNDNSNDNCLSMVFNEIIHLVQQGSTVSGLDQDNQQCPHVLL